MADKGGHRTIETSSSRICDLDSQSGPVQPHATHGTHVNLPGNTGGYIPMDVHPNPFGHLPPSQVSFPPPICSEKRNSLPSNSMPVYNALEYTVDAQMQPAYISPEQQQHPKITPEYMRNYEEEARRQLKQNTDKRAKESKMELVIDTFRIPVFMALLFFIFNMPAFNLFLLKHMSFASIYDSDQSFTMYGLVFKSILFGLAYLAFFRFVEFVSEI